MLTREQAFRVGFLTRCSEEGLCGQALNDRLDAAAVFAKSADWLETAINAPRSVMLGAGSLALLGGAVGGAGVGALAGSLSTPEDPGKIKPPPFLQNVQRSEYAAALRQQAMELKRLREGRGTMAPSRSHYGI